MKSIRTSLLILGCAIVAQTGVSAATQFTASITNAQENPVTVPTTVTGAPRTSFGTATFTLNDAMTALTFSATITGIDVTGSQSADVNDNLTAAHIHAAAAPGANAGVVWGFFGSPQNNINPADQVNTPFASGVGGTFTGTWNLTEGNNTTLTAQVPNLLAGLAYINFHTTQFGGGEIRGQILPAGQGVPDAGASALLLGLGFMSILGVRKMVRAVPRTGHSHRD